MDTPSYLLSISIHRMAETYVVELSHSDPTSQARVAPVRGVAAFDGPWLLAHATSGPTYGEEFADQEFADAAVARRFGEVRDGANSQPVRSGAATATSAVSSVRARNFTGRKSRETIYGPVSEVVAQTRKGPAEGPRQPHDVLAVV